MTPAFQVAGTSRPALLSLGLANALALAAAVAGSAVVATWLDPALFACWAMAMTAGRCGLLLLDGGIKAALVRRAAAPGAAMERAVLRWCAGAALLLVVALGAGLLALVHTGRLPAAAALLVWGPPAACWLTYAALPVPLARLERAQRFGVIGRAEGVSVALEFLLPLLLLAAAAPAWLAFTLATLAARGLRTAWVWHAGKALALQAGAGAPGAAGPHPTQPLSMAAMLWREGAGLQAVALLSQVRDTMHLWLLAPWFGSGWAGAYALALTACALASQVATATAARVLLPALCSTAAAGRWPVVLARTRQVAICTLPLVALVPAVLAWLDANLWAGRWLDAVAVAPWLALRMLGGAASTVVGTWLLAVRSPWRSAQAHAAWAATELALATAALALAGPQGLAWALAVGVWPGLLWLLHAATPGVGWAQRARWMALLARAVLGRPSAWVGVLLAVLLHRHPAWLPWCVLALPLCWLAEPAVWRQLRSAWASRGRHPRLGSKVAA